MSGTDAILYVMKVLDFFYDNHAKPSIPGTYTAHLLYKATGFPMKGHKDLKRLLKPIISSRVCVLKSAINIVVAAIDGRMNNNSAALMHFPGDDPNEMWSRTLQDNLNSFRKLLSSCDDAYDLLTAYDAANELAFDQFIKRANQTQSKINPEVIGRITNVFGTLITTAQSIGTAQYNLNQLYGVLQCSYSVGYTIGKGSRRAAEKLESIGSWTTKFQASDFEIVPVHIVWDHLAWFSSEVVRFFGKLVSCRTPDEIFFLKPPDLQLRRICELLQEEVAKRQNKGIGQKQEEDLRERAKTEEINRQNKEIEKVAL
ncbi:MAG: hypothetical protein M1834_007147 [Cirrosporium novae-zelandiae]|nr:MAG: hypothetical protein M1834_007147 [Cirrosporium novae-zelandiae]